MSEYIDDDEAEFIANEVARIAALHKSAPEIIWLQVDPEAEQFDGWDAQTWCSDQINGTDVKYLKAIDVKAQTAELKQQRDELLTALQWYADRYSNENGKPTVAQKAIAKVKP